MFEHCRQLVILFGKIVDLLKGGNEEVSHQGKNLRVPSSVPLPLLYLLKYQFLDLTLC